LKASDLCGGELEGRGDVVAVSRREVLLATEASLELAQLLATERRPRLAALAARPQALGADVGHQRVVTPLVVQVMCGRGAAGGVAWHLPTVADRLCREQSQSLRIARCCLPVRIQIGAFKPDHWLYINLYSPKIR